MPHEIHEASAGTGKTYQVVQKVLSLIREGMLIEKILVVTFTEKATAELVDRIRAGLESERLKKADALTRARFDAALENYDSAQIFTIHGFCLRILQQFPFDHDFASNAQLARDDEIRLLCLRGIQRKRWPELYGPMLPSLLALSEFDDDWETSVLRAARAWRTDCEHQMHPEQHIDLALLQEFSEEIAAVHAELAKIAGPLKTTVDEHAWYVRYGELKFKNVNWMAGRRKKFFTPALLWITDEIDAVEFTPSFLRLNRIFEKEKQTFDWFATAAIKDTEKSEFATIVRDLARQLDALRVRIPNVRHALARQTAELLNAELEQHKSQRGVQTFDDFLTRVARALDDGNEHSAALLEKLRERYDVAIVDEFQDTDPLQWNIFRRIFVESPLAHRLIVVGDPKQAIYAFRNADLQTYVGARTALQGKNATEHPLKQNFRSSAHLLDGLNTLFRPGDDRTDFFDDPDVRYQHVEKAPDGQRPEPVTDDTGRRAITLLRCPDGSAGTRVLPNFAASVAAEIEHLLNPGGKPRLTFNNRGAPIPLTAGGIAVLVFKRSESELIEKELTRRQIPFSFYKKQGIWQSSEATHLYFLLKAVAEPGDRSAHRAMLISRFFNVPPENVPLLEQAAGDDRLHWLMMHWRESAQRRRWAELFRSILCDTGALREEVKQPDGGRRVANHNYITQELCRAAYQQGLSLPDIIELLLSKRLISREDESGLHPVETEKPAVQILTIHTSKGLEFPVVFVAGGFTQPPEDAYLKYHDDQRRLVLNLDANDPNSTLSKEERTREQRRLLYVALTRAMVKLYIPHFPGGKTGKPGPLKTLLMPALDQLPKDHTSFGEMQLGARPISPGLRPVRVAGAPGPFPVPPIPLTSPLLPELNIGQLASRRVQVQSFSRLVHGTGVVVHAPELERPPREDDDEPQEFIEDPLPPGADAGEILHDILEHIDFSTVAGCGSVDDLLSKRSDTLALIENSIEKHLPKKDPDVTARRLRRTAEIVWKTLRTPIPELGGKKLCELASTERLHELEFHMRVRRNHLVIEEIEIRDGFMTGFMDLVFRHDRKYFLLDWKSNALRGYSRAALTHDIEARQYNVQYSIYMEALRTWLGRDDPKLFGGVFYIYMRGIGAGENTNGIFFCKP